MTVPGDGVPDRTPERDPAVHLAVTSTATLRYPLRDPRMTELLDGVERINRLAEETPGFVWRRRGAAGHSAMVATPAPGAISSVGPKAPGGAEILVNVTLWRDYPSFHRFTYRGLHGQYLTARERWFLPVPGPNTVLWWAPVAVRPDVEEGLARLAVLRREGPSPRAFSVLRRWHADGTPDRTRRTPLS